MLIVAVEASEEPTRVEVDLPISDQNPAPGPVVAECRHRFGRVTGDLVDRIGSIGNGCDGEASKGPA